MRIKIGLFIALLTIGTLFAWWSSVTANQKADAVKAEPAKIVEDDRAAIADKLMVRRDFEKIDQVPFKEVVALLGEKLDVSIIVDIESFSRGNDAAAAFVNAPADLERMITTPALKKIRGATLLQMVANQLEATYLIYPDHIKIVSLAAAAEIIHLENRPLEGEDNPSAFPAPIAAFLATKLVNVKLVERPLPEALKEIERRVGITIALAPQAADKSKTIITAEFSNVPVDRAVATVAEMAGLKSVKKGNVILVTTSKRAKEFGAPPPRPVEVMGGGMLPQLDDPTGIVTRYGLEVTRALQRQQVESEALKKKVADLEKQLEDMKKK
jgi:hypothetical protein